MALVFTAREEVALRYPESRLTIGRVRDPGAGPSADDLDESAGFRPSSATWKVQRVSDGP